MQDSVIVEKLQKRDCVEMHSFGFIMEMNVVERKRQITYHPNFELALFEQQCVIDIYIFFRAYQTIFVSIFFLFNFFLLYMISIFQCINKLMWQSRNYHEDEFTKPIYFINFNFLFTFKYEHRLFRLIPIWSISYF